MTALLAPALRWRAERMLARGRPAAALRLYHRLAARRGAPGSDRLRCAALVEEQGDRAGAIALLLGWVSDSPAPELRRRLAEALMRAGRHAESAEHWAILVHEGALPPETLLQLGAVIADQGAVARAEGMFSDSFHAADDPELRRAAWRHYAAMAEAAGQHDAALDRWKLLSAFAPPEEEDWRHVATLAARLGEAETAREAMTHLSDPDDRFAVRQLLADRAHDWAAARRAATERLALACPGSDDEAELCRSLVRYAVRAGDDRGAVRAFFDFRRRDPEALATEATAVVQAAQALKRMGRPARAEAILRAHLAARREAGQDADPRADLFLAELLMARGARPEAIAALDRAALGAPAADGQTRPDARGRPPLNGALEARRLRLWAHIAWAEGARNEAAELFRRANGTGHATEASLLREVEAWASLGRTRERSLALRHGLARLPGSLALARHAALFAEEEGDWESAAQAWGHCVELHPGNAGLACRFALALLEARRPYHFLSVVEALPKADVDDDDDNDDAPPPGADAGEEVSDRDTTAFDMRLAAAYRRLLREPDTLQARESAILARLARSPAQSAAAARFAARAARAPAAGPRDEPATVSDGDASVAAHRGDRPGRPAGSPAGQARAAARVAAAAAGPARGRPRDGGHVPGARRDGVQRDGAGRGSAPGGA